MTSRAVRPFSLTVPPETFFCDDDADVVFACVGVEGNLGTLEPAQEFVLVGVKALVEPVEGRVSGSAFEDAVEAGSQFDRALRVGGELEHLALTIEPPDHQPRAFDGAAGHWSLVDEALGVDPAQGVVADAELSGVVGKDDGAGEPILSADRAPQRGFAGCAHGDRGSRRNPDRPSARKCARQSASPANSRTCALCKASMSPWARLAARI